MWWDTRTALAVTWLFGLTLARRDVEMFMTPEDKSKYYVEEGGSISITCNVVVDKNVKVDLKWKGPSINSSEPQRLSNNPQGELEKVGNMLSVNDFNSKTAGKYICEATLSPGIPIEGTIELVKSCDVGKFNPPTCDESCSAFCKVGPQGAQGRNCDHINGTCLYGCQEGHTGLKCTEKTEESGDEKVIAGAIGGVLGLALIAVLVILLVRHLRKKGVCCKKDENKYKGNNKAVSGDKRTDTDEREDLLLETSGVSQTPATDGNRNNEAVEQLEQKLEEQRQKYEQDLGKVSAERDDFKGKWEESGRKIDELQKLIVHVNEKLKKVEEAKEEQWQATQHEIEGYKKEIEGYKKELDELTAERDDFKSKWEETNRKHDQLVEQIANLTKEVNELKETKCDQEKVMQLIREYKDEPPAIDLARKSASKDEETCSTDAGVDLRL